MSSSSIAAHAADDGPLHGDACRCACGSLLGRLVPGGVEIKCRRCKRTLVIALEPDPETARSAAPGASSFHHPRPEVPNPEPQPFRRAGRGEGACGSGSPGSESR
jgi:hypothetical protein